MNGIKFPAGTYYVGDLCYVMNHRWNEICKLTIIGNDCYDGSFNLPNGTRFAMFATKYGDGSYPDTISGQKVAVDSGTVGIVAVKDTTWIERVVEDQKLGMIVTFDEPFWISFEDYFFKVGDKIEIDTSGEDRDSYWDDDFNWRESD
jgi:hypothetical protein